MSLDSIFKEKVPEPNGVATNTGIGTIGVYIDPKTGKTQTPLPIGAIVTPSGSSKSWRVTGGTPGNYTSELVTNNTQANGAGGRTGTTSVENMYKNMYRNMVGAQNNMTNIAVNQLESQKKGVNTAFDASARNAYTNYMLNNKNLSERLIRSGLSQGGMSESAQVASNSAYGAQLMNNETGRNQAIADIDSKIADLRYKGEEAKQSAKNRIDEQLIDYYRDNEIRNQDRLWQLEDIYRDRNWKEQDDDKYRGWELDDAERERKWQVDDAYKNRAWAVQDRDMKFEVDKRSDLLSALMQMGNRNISDPPQALLDALGITQYDYLAFFY